MFNLFRKPKEETVSKAEHERIVAMLQQDARALDALAGRFKQQRDAARIEAAANADAAAKYRRSVANLKQNRRQAREKQAAE